MGYNGNYQGIQKWILACCNGGKCNHSLFNVLFDIEEHNEIEMETNPTEATSIKMEKCLQ